MALSLEPVQETLLIPLYARADLTRRGGALIDDPRAVEMVEAIDYDFAPFDDRLNSIGCVLRTRIHDRWVEGWLAEHPAGTVVEIGAGLNTRFERLDNGLVHWIDLDLPQAISLRREFFADTSRRRMVAASVTSEAWMQDVISTTPGPWFLVAEAVLIYLPEPDVRGVFTALSERFTGASFTFDTWGAWIRDNPDQHAVLGKVDARVQWICDDPYRLPEWGTGIEVRESHNLSGAPQELLRALPDDVQAMVPALAADPQASSYRQVLTRL